jgi:hypothetical protein
MRLLAFVLLAGCFGNQNGGPTCPAGTSYIVDTGATITYAPGIDAGYYVTYAAGGHWHLEWTCDTKLSAYGCNFVGSITAQTPPGGVNATCFMCEVNQDSLSVTPRGAETELDFATGTSSGIDGVDFFAVAGQPIHVDLQINSIYQNDLVFLPENGHTASPTCMPADFVPSSP